MTDMNVHYEAFEAVRSTGEVNMMASARVAEMLLDMGYHETFDYIVKPDGRIDRQKYMQVLLKKEES